MHSADGGGSASPGSGQSTFAQGVHLDVENVRLLIASINVTSAVSGGGAAREHTYETGGLIMTGRMAELDYLFSDADLDIIGCKRADCRKRRFCGRMGPQSSTLERCLASIITVCSCGSRNITQKP